MAQLTRKEQSIDVENGIRIFDAAEDLGVTFSCCHGVCGACLIEVVSGAEHIEEPTQSEIEFGIEGNERLACQCKIKSGEVVIEQKGLDDL
ncbi:MAG: 2Fe-2S iron-sulfur cluster binding domain-containing protein [Fibrobacterales bacterium]